MRPVIWVLSCLAFHAVAEDIDFNREIRPILASHCFACHGPDEARCEAGLRLDDFATATKPLESGVRAIVPGNSEDSELVKRVGSVDPNLRMPPASFGKSLTEKDVSLLRRWIEQGANYAKHWAYVPPVKRAPPEIQGEHAAWPRSDLDRFILEKMLEKGLRPSPEADRETIARRVFLDLIGLPPTIAEIDAFLADPAEDAYERMVDRLLRRPEYGEHWARQWLDLARYADSSGYADDPMRTIWGYRDWVIGAFERNLPFDQFTVEQLAGDLLPEPSEDQLIATAFHRNTMTNNEGGTNDEEFRNVAVVDRVNTTYAVWMGTTMSCAQCHSHKYDPLSQEEYFQSFAIFNNCEDADKKDESPVLELFTTEQRQRKQELSEKIQKLQSQIDTLSEEPSVDAALAGALVKDGREDESALLVTAKEELAKAKKELAEIKPRTTVPILRELATPRKTALQYRGNYLDKGPEVFAGVPAIFHPLRPRTTAETAKEPVDRLAFAKWLVARENPLTARVLVNRYWETLFGRGIVVTSEEFGTQGEPPTHPELLDWLAEDVMDYGWDLHHLLKRIVTSSTYRQSSKADEESLRIDRDNRWLARGPRVRLTAEMVRDQALAVSGLLSNKRFGPPVKPPQPNLGLTAAFGSSTDWQTSEGEDRYRRAIYTTWRRSNPYPSMATFDAPNREVCTVRRTQTNTPLQSLVTLNDPVFLEAAQSLARRAIGNGDAPGEPRSTCGTGPKDMATLFRTCLLRNPSNEELDSLMRLYRDSHRKLSEEPEEAKRLATEPLGPLPNEINPIEAAALTVVCNVLLNLDEMLCKP